MPPSFTRAEYVRREKVAATGLTVAFFTWLMGNITRPQVRGGGSSLALAGAPLLAVLIGVGTWLYARPARRAWADAMRAQAPGALEPLEEAERAVLRRVIRQRRIAGFLMVGIAVLFAVGTLGLLGYLGGVEAGAPVSGAAIAGALVSLGLAALVAWSGLRSVAAARTLLRRVDAPGALGMRLRGPFVGRQFIAPPRLGGIPLTVLDQRWLKALGARSGTEVELLVAPTFADEPKPGAMRVLVRAPGAGA